MTKLSITLAATALCISFAPAARAYSTEPAPLFQGAIPQIPAPTGQETARDDACVLPISPQLASVLALPGDWRTSEVTDAQNALACAAE